VWSYYVIIIIIIIIITLLLVFLWLALLLFNLHTNIKKINLIIFPLHDFDWCEREVSVYYRESRISMYWSRLYSFDRNFYFIHSKLRTVKRCC
jgi:hypothetical protein